MRDVKTGEFETLEVTRATTVNGAVRGAIVRRGAALFVQGHVDGDLNVENEAHLTVYGNFAPADVDNAGVIMVAGNLPVPPWRWREFGQLAVAPGTLLDGRAVLMKDGSQMSLAEHGTDLQVTTDIWCLWRDDEKRFTVLPGEHDAC